MRVRPGGGLGYAPHAGVTHWRGTPIPPCDTPLRRSSRRWEIAERLCWNGPPWALLRNASAYLWHVMDYGTDADLHHALRDVRPGLWRRAIKQARPGLLSRRSYMCFSILLGEKPPEWVCDWPEEAHRLDVRPLANASREALRCRYRRREGKRWGLYT